MEIFFIGRATIPTHIAKFIDYFFQWITIFARRPMFTI